MKNNFFVTGICTSWHLRCHARFMVPFYVERSEIPQQAEPALKQILEVHIAEKKNLKPVTDWQLFASVVRDIRIAINYFN